MGKEKANTRQTGNMSSIARELHGQMVRKKLGIYLGADILLFLALSFIWLLAAEVTALGDNGIRWAFPRIIDIHLKRSLETGGLGMKNLTYQVSSGGEVILQQNVYNAFILIVSIVAVVAVLQILGVFFSYYSEHKRIKETLKPINEIALRADELTRLSFDDAKFHT